AFILLLTPLTLAQGQDASTVFHHSDTSRFWIAGQLNVIHQQNPSFFARYSGENSFGPDRQKATSRVMTLYTGFELTKSSEVLVDLESAGGRGLSEALGLAGFTNLDVVRNPTLGSTPYVARAMFHKVIALTRETEPAERNFLSLMTEKPEKRIEIYAGRFSMADFFDINPVGSDSHLQFMNWTVDNN